MKEKIYILLPVHNRRSITLQFIQCLKQQSHQNYQLILVDDGSVDDTSKAVLEQLPQTIVLKGNGKLWWAGCINRAIDYMYSASVEDSSVILMINDDTTFNNEFLQQACISLAEYPGSLLLARKLDIDTGNVLESGLHLDISKMTFSIANDSSEINCLSTRGLFMHWSDLQKIGKLRERWLPHYGSDMEFTYRAYKEGYTLRTDERVCLSHDKSSRDDKQVMSEKVTLKTLFSRRYDSNPLELTKLALLVSPGHLLVQNILRIWCRSFKQLVKC